MTEQRRDAEGAIREWLADSAPNRAPASLKEALDSTTSQPPGRATPWPGSGGHRLLFAGRVAAAAAILAIAVSGVYLYGNGRGTSPGQGTGGPSTSPVSKASATGTASPSASTASPRPLSTIVQLPGSSWRLVSGAFPQMVSPAWAPFQPTVFELTGGASVGFVAFVPSAAVMASHRPGNAILAAFTTAGPTAPTSWETRVYQSSDGVQWAERSALPSDTATVTAVAESGGSIVAVGWTGDFPTERATTWTTTDLETWRSAEPPIPAQSDTYSDVSGVAAGPSGLLAWGDAGTTSMFWSSDDGAAWTSLAWSGLPAEAPVEELFGVSDGWAIMGYLSDRAAIWHSSDGARWTRIWTGPGMSGQEGYGLGPIFKTPAGGYISFGTLGATGNPPGAPNDMLVSTSQDLLHWTISDLVHRPGWMYSFAAGPGGFVGAGQQVTGDNYGEAEYGSLGVWTSQDGRSWQAVADIPSVNSIEVLSVIGDGAHVVVVCVDSQGDLQLLVGDGRQ
jgi:hypothetical protein